MPEIKTRPVYALPPPNRYLWNRGGLIHLADPDNVSPSGMHRSVFRGPGQESWLDPEELEELLFADPQIRQAAEAAQLALGTRNELRTQQALHRAVQAVFETQLIPLVIQRFDAASSLVTQYVLAKYTHQNPQ